MPPDMGCEQPRTDAEEITFSVMREMLYFDTRFERKNYCERYTRELESAAEAGCGYAWLLLGWFFSEQPSAFRCSTEVPTVEECFKRRNCIIKKLSKRAKMPHGRFWANFTFSAAAVRGCIPKIALKKRWNSSNLRRRAAMLPRRSCWRRCTETMFTMNRLSMCNGCLKWACETGILVEGEDG